jgi:hypothetical protein
MNTQNKLHYASLSQQRDDDGFWRVFYYAEGTGFEAGRSVYVGRSQFLNLEKAKEAAKRYNAHHEKDLG